MLIIKWMLFFCLSACQLAVAQPNSKTQPKSSAATEAQTLIGQAVRWRASSSTGKVLDIADLKGSVVLYFYWTTSCHVCLEAMAELRENVKGWKGKPFLLVTVNLDSKRDDYDNYAKISKTIIGNDEQCLLVYHKDTLEDRLSRPGQLPASYVVDTKGVLRFSYLGRIPAKAWDDIADLMP